MKTELRENTHAFAIKTQRQLVLAERKFAYLELYLHYGGGPFERQERERCDNDRWMFFYVGQGGKERVQEYTANGGSILYNPQTRVEVFSIPICPLLANEFAASLRSGPKFGKSAYFDGISKAQTEIERIYEAFLYESFYKLCKDLTNSNPNFTTDFELGSAERYEEYLEGELGTFPHKWGAKRVQPTAFLSCANKAYFTRIPTEANEYKKFFLDEFCKISDQIKSTLLKFFVNKSQNVSI